MEMMNLSAVALATLLGFFQLPAWAQVGGSDVGGGQGVVCYSPSGHVHKVELLDLWEARNLYGRNPKATSASTSQLVEAALDIIKYSIPTSGYTSYNTQGKALYSGPQAFRDLLADSYPALFLEIGNQHVHHLRGVNLKLTTDAFESVTPKSPCQIEQLVRYRSMVNGSYILINQDLVDKMDPTNQAALAIHEAFYSILRLQGEVSSLRIRRTVGLTFSGYIFRPFETSMPEDLYLCQDSAATNQVFIFQNPSDRPGYQSYSYQVARIAGRSMIDQPGP